MPLRSFLANVSVNTLVLGMVVGIFTVAQDQQSPLSSAKFYAVGGTGLLLAAVGTLMLFMATRGPAEGHITVPSAYYVYTKLVLTAGALALGLAGGVPSLTYSGGVLLLLVAVFELILPRSRQSGNICGR